MFCGAAATSGMLGVTVGFVSMFCGAAATWICRTYEDVMIEYVRRLRSCLCKVGCWLRWVMFIIFLSGIYDAFLLLLPLLPICLVLCATLQALVFASQRALQWCEEVAQVSTKWTG